MKYSLFLPSIVLSLSQRYFFTSYCRLWAASLWQRASDIGKGSQRDVHARVCLWVCDIGGITPTSILLDSCLLPSDASHLRHRHRRPSKPSACLSLLIDLSLDGGVWECFRENMYLDRFSAHECVPYIRKGEALTKRGSRRPEVN